MSTSINDFYGGTINLTSSSINLSAFYINENSNYHCENTDVKIIFDNLSGNLFGLSIKNTLDFNLTNSNLSTYIKLDNSNAYIHNVHFLNSDSALNQNYILSAVNNSNTFLDATCTFTTNKINKVYAEKNSQVTWLQKDITENNTNSANWHRTNYFSSRK